MSEVLSYDAAALASKVAMEQTEEVICPVCKVCVWNVSFHANVNCILFLVLQLPVLYFCNGIMPMKFKRL